MCGCVSVRNGATGETNFLPGVASQQQQGWEFRVCFTESEKKRRLIRLLNGSLLKHTQLLAISTKGVVIEPVLVCLGKLYKVYNVAFD